MIDRTLRVALVTLIAVMIGQLSPVFGDIEAQGADLKDLTIVGGANADPAPLDPREALLNKGYHGGTSNARLWQRMTGQPGHGGMTGLWVMALLGVLVVVGGYWGVSASRRRGGKASEAPPSDMETAGPDRRRRAVLKKCACLEDLLAEGRIDPAVFEQLMAEYQQELVRVGNGLKSSDND